MATPIITKFFTPGPRPLVTVSHKRIIAPTPKHPVGCPRKRVRLDLELIQAAKHGQERAKDRQENARIGQESAKNGQEKAKDSNGGEESCNETIDICDESEGDKNDASIANQGNYL